MSLYDIIIIKLNGIIRKERERPRNERKILKKKIERKRPI